MTDKIEEIEIEIRKIMTNLHRIECRITKLEAVNEERFRYEIKMLSMDRERKGL